MAPSFFVCAGFSLSAACCILNMQNWNTQIDIVTIGVIVLSVCIFGAGNLCGESVTFRAVHVKQFPVFDFSGNQRIRVKKLAIAAIESALIVINICYFRYIYQLSVIAGNRIGIAGMISYARHASNYLNTGYDMPVIVSQGIVLTKCIAYVFLFAFVYNLLNDRPKSRYFMLLLPCASHSVNIVLSTARIGFIEFFVYIFFFGFLCQLTAIVLFFMFLPPFFLSGFFLPVLVVYQNSRNKSIFIPQDFIALLVIYNTAFL